MHNFDAVGKEEIDCDCGLPGGRCRSTRTACAESICDHPDPHIGSLFRQEAHRYLSHPYLSTKV